MSRNSSGGDETIRSDDAPVTFSSWLVNILEEVVKTSMKRSGVITLNSCGVATMSLSSLKYLKTAGRNF